MGGIIGVSGEEDRPMQLQGPDLIRIPSSIVAMTSFDGKGGLGRATVPGSSLRW